MLVLCSALRSGHRLLPNLIELVNDITIREELAWNPVAILDSKYSFAENIITKDQLEQWEFQDIMLDLLPTR